MSRMSLQFLRNEADEDEGLSDAGIETFRGAPFASVARESGQNSRDAAVKFPVRLEFDVVSIPANELPDNAVFQDVLDACLDRGLNRNETKEIEFFRNAIRTASSQELFALRVADYGTTGLRGPCTPGAPFHSLVKASGVSNKTLETSGGSFGIGKKAAFAVSDLHVVFYSTVYEVDHGQLAYLAQGKCTLVSHERAGEKFRATGYWGSASFMPCDDQDEVPSWMQRDRVGTTTFSLGFSKSKDWSWRIAESLLRNFFAAVHREQLEFGVDESTITFDRSTLPALFKSEQIVEAAEAQGAQDEFEFARQLYECLVSDEAVISEITIPGLGAFTMRVLVADGLPKRVGIIRNGMYIADNLQHFGERFAHFPMYKDFVALVEPSSDESSAIVKRLENPKHDELSVERLIKEDERKRVRSAMNKLKKWIRDGIRSQALAPPQDEVAIDELNEFFNDVGDSDSLDPPKDGEPNPLAVHYSPPKRLRTDADGGVGENKDQGGGGDRNKGTGGKRTGVGGGKGATDGGSGGGQDLTFEDFRNVPDGAEPALRRALFFTPINAGKARLSLLAKGISEDVYLQAVIKDESGLPVGDLSLEPGKRLKLVAEFSEPYRGPISIRLRPVSSGGATDEAD